MIVGYAKSGSSVRNPCDRQKNRKRSRGPCSLQGRTSIPRTRESLSKNHSRIYIYYFFFFVSLVTFVSRHLIFRDLPLVLSFSLVSSIKKLSIYPFTNESSHFTLAFNFFSLSIFFPLFYFFSTNSATQFAAISRQHRDNFF